MLLLMLPFVLLTGPLFDGEMTSLERKKTGIAKLNEKEKKSLQEWIDSRYTKQDETIAKAATKKAPLPTILENLSNGKYIRLSDNSLWEINPSDTPITQGWITPAGIVTSPSGQKDYPVKLTNSLTGSSVHAKPASSVPPELAPKPLPETNEENAETPAKPAKPEKKTAPNTGL